MAGAIPDNFEELFSPNHGLEEAPSDHFGAFHNVDDRLDLVVDLFGDSAVTPTDKSQPLNTGLEDTLMDLSSEDNVSMASTFYL